MKTGTGVGQSAHPDRFPAAEGCVTLWIGSALGPVERACMRSVLRQGHSLALYCYRRPDDVPDGVEVRDASTILAEKHVFFHRRSGSVALFADWFRYELQRRALGIWIDTDNYLISPINQAEPYLFGEESPGLINNAVLRLPSNSPMLSCLLEPFETKSTPNWLPWHRYALSRCRDLFRRETDLARLPWGSTGPAAITALAKRLGLSSHAQPREVFNPVHWRNAGWIRDPVVKVEDVVTEQTVSIHLWNHCIKGFKNLPAPEGSFLSRLQQEGKER